jgi:hypothetical protein
MDTIHECIWIYELCGTIYREQNIILLGLLSLVQNPSERLNQNFENILNQWNSIVKLSG